MSPHRILTKVDLPGAVFAEIGRVDLASPQGEVDVKENPDRTIVFTNASSLKEHVRRVQQFPRPMVFCIFEEFSDGSHLFPPFWGAQKDRRGGGPRNLGPLDAPIETL